MDNVDLKTLMANGGAGRHETFTPRYGWLKKGYEAASKDGKVFNAVDSIERLGVGKNMVQSIRAWCLAFHILERAEDKTGKDRGGLRPTKLGKWLLADEGWDPYLEDLASLWLLHYQLFLPPFEAVSWPLVFNHCTLPTFDLKHLSLNLTSAAQQYSKLSSLSQGSLDKDASCLIRMYSDSKTEGKSDIYCPFTQLDIVKIAEEQSIFRFNISEKQTLPALVFTACCFAYAAITQPNQRTLSMHKAVYELNSPGIAFKLSETTAGRLLDNAAGRLKGVYFVESLGNRQLQFEEGPDNLFWKSLNLYYSGNTSEVK